MDLDFQQLHSATVITDASGEQIRHLVYRAFGEQAESTGPGPQPKYTYTGKEADATGLLYYGARYYDPALARFLTPDTIYDRGPQGLNRYSYALNNPIIYIDPTGHFVNGPDDDPNPNCDGCMTGSPMNGGDDMVFHENDDDPSSIHYGAPYEHPIGSHRTYSMDEVAFLHPAGQPGVLYGETGDRIVNTTFAVTDVAWAILWEPYDWASTGYRWTKGEFSWWDLAGLLPLIPAASIKYFDEAGGAVKALLHNSGELMGVEKASPELLEAITRKGRTLDFALSGTDDLRYLNSIPAEAAVGGPEYLNILVRQNPSKAAVLEEFLHGTQYKLGVIDELGIAGAEQHVKDFMIRHQDLLGLSGEDVEILKQLRDAGL